MRAAIAGALLALFLAGSASAQTRAPGVAIMNRPGTTMVAATLLVPTGSADDPGTLPGAARLVGEAIAQAVRWRLDPDAARLDVRVERGWTSFTLLAAPELWTRSWGVLEDVAFRISLADAPLEAARTALLDEFTFETGAPIREFERELYYVLGGSRNPWSREPRGDPDALKKAEQKDLESFRASHYQLAQAIATVVGPVNDAEAIAALSPVGDGPLDLPRTRGPAWSRGERIPLPREVTNAWIAAAFPAPRNLPRTQLEFVGFQIEEALNPSPPDPGVYSVSVHLEDTPDGPVLVVEAAVMPEVTDIWERRILASVGKLREQTDDVFFRQQRRRFRSAILLREGEPEAAALRMALDLAREGRVRPLQDEVWSIGPKELAKATDDLQEPRVLLMGPDISAR